VEKISLEEDMEKGLAVEETALGQFYSLLSDKSKVFKVDDKLVSFDTVVEVDGIVENSTTASGIKLHDYTLKVTCLENRIHTIRGKENIFFFLKNYLEFLEGPSEI
jgi:hypothetical protein